MRELLVPSNNEPWQDVRDTLNRTLRGWSKLTSVTERGGQHSAASNSTSRERVRAFLVRRHKVAGRGNNRFPFEVLHWEHGVLCLERLP